MTLRRRLIAGFLAIAVTLAIADLVVAVIQRNTVVRQLDAQLESARPLAQKIVNQFAQRDPGGDATVVKGGTYVGHLLPSGELIALITPASDPTMSPDVSNPSALSSPRTRRTTSGVTQRVRVLAAPLKDGSTAIVAVSAASSAAAARKAAITMGVAALVVLAVMGLVIAWVNRFGLLPIRRMTDAADAITAGALDSRIEVIDNDTEAARLGNALNTMIDTNRASQERLRRFVADASHELRTPLTTLLGYSALYEAGGFTTADEISDAMARMGREAARMARMVDDLLLLARLDEAGASVLVPVDLRGVLTDVASDAHVVQPQREILLVCPEPFLVMADRDHLLQAVTAYVSNALRHTEPSTDLVISAEQLGSVVRIAVSDRGEGIDPSVIDHVFERFYRSDTGRARSSGGTGLGLAIVASIVDEHGGRCGVDSEPGVGSTFWIELPLLEQRIR
jgi:two-component system OmpR family sensor kinase